MCSCDATLNLALIFKSRWQRRKQEKEKQHGSVDYPPSYDQLHLILPMSEFIVDYTFLSTVFFLSFSDDGVGFGRWQQPVCPASLKKQPSFIESTNNKQTNKSKGWREFSQVHPKGTARLS